MRQDPEKNGNREISGTGKGSWERNSGSVPWSTVRPASKTVLLGGSTSRRILRVVTAITTRSKFGVLLIPENTRGKNVA